MYFGDWLARWAVYSPEKIALVDSSNGRRTSYRELNWRCDQLAGALRGSFGVGKGDRVAVLAHNCQETLELFFALGKLGAVMVPVNFRLTVPEVKYILSDASPKVLFYGPEFADTVRGLAPELDIAHVVPYVAEAANPGYDGVLAAYAGTTAPTPAEISLDDPHVILYTSGTTGFPKGAMLTHGTITWNAINTQVGWDLHHDDITLTHTPFFHTGGLNVLTTPLIHRGGTIVMMRNFDAAKSLELIAKEQVTVVFAVPTMFQMMLEAPNFKDADLSSIRFFITGGAPCPVPLIEAYAERGMTFKQGYGLTEAGPNCFTLDGRDAIRKAGSVGFPNFHVDVRVVDSEGSEVPAGAVGELLIRGPHVIKGYWKNPQATQSSIRDGWLHTGDLVRRDEEGYYYIVDRIKDMIISGGENIYPAELEHLLLQHPAVSEVAVIGLPHMKWGEVGHIVAVLKPDTTAEAAELISFLGERVARYKLPKTVSFVDSLPRNPTGKVQKNLLRDQHATPAVAR